MYVGLYVCEASPVPSLQFQAALATHTSPLPHVILQAFMTTRHTFAIRLRPWGHTYELVADFSLA